MASLTISLVERPPVALTTTNATYVLTTVFTPPSSCLQPTFTASPSGSDSVAGSKVFRGLPTECFPSLGASTSSGQDTSTVTTTLYSPGICFQGYTAVLDNIGPQDVTTAICCPSGMSWTLQNCTRSYTSGSAIIVEDGTSSPAADITEIASSVVVAWQSSDAVDWPSSVLARNLMVTSTASSTSESPASSSDSISSVVSATAVAPSGLSTGAKAGIGVGVTMGVIAVCFVIGIFMWRRKHKAKTSEQDFTGQKAELPGEGVEKPASIREELGHDAAVHEADGFSKPAEFDNNVRAELDAGWAGWEAPVPREDQVARSRPGEEQL